MNKQLSVLANRLSVDEKEIHNVLMKTVMPNGGKGVTEEQFISFVAVANDLDLNPLRKEIYAFSNKGGIQPIIGIDGWLKIMNSHPAFDGITYDYIYRGDDILGVTAKIFRKDRTRPIEVTEYLEECRQNTEPWKKYPFRMLRHKATSQCVRTAFGITGVCDDDFKEEKTVYGETIQSVDFEKEPLTTVQKVLEKSKKQPDFDIGPWCDSMRGTTTLEELKTVFGGAYKGVSANGTDEQVEQVKMVYEELKQNFIKELEKSAD
jgi:phage recombination protein Bet